MDRKNLVPHFKGYAKCATCSYIWIAMVPKTCRALYLQCPKCTNMRGRFIGPIEETLA